MDSISSLKNVQKYCGNFQYTLSRDGSSTTAAVELTVTETNELQLDLNVLDPNFSGTETWKLDICLEDFCSSTQHSVEIKVKTETTCSQIVKKFVELQQYAMQPLTAEINEFDGTSTIAEHVFV